MFEEAKLLEINLHRGSTQFTDTQWYGFRSPLNIKVPVLLKSEEFEKDDPDFYRADKVIGVLASIQFTGENENKIQILLYTRLMGCLISDLRLFDFEFTDDNRLCAVWLAIKPNQDSNKEENKS